MAFQEGQLAVGTTPVQFVDPGVRGALIWNAGTVPLTLGGPNVKFGTGPQLAAASAPIWIYGAPVVGGAIPTDFIHAIAAGTAGGSIAWVAPV